MKFYQQILLLFLFICGSVIANAQTTSTIRYVAPVASGTGDGSSWANASGDIQAMITASAAGDQVFVKKGTYTRNLANAFLIRMKEGVKIYGSFQGTESSLAERVIGTAAADSSVLNGTSTPAYPTVYNLSNALTAASVLDGFFLTNTGNRNIYNRGSASVHFNATFSNLIIANGRSGHGGGVYNDYSSPTFNNVIFRNNGAINGNGGAMYNINGSSPILNNVVFENNFSASTNLSSAGFGGAMFNQGGAGPSIPVLTNVIFRNNTANIGGGMYITGFDGRATNITLNNVTFEGNTAGRGGGMYNYFANPILNDVKIVGNTATTNAFGWGGGGILNDASSPILNRVFISGNSATGNGGGIYNTTNSYGSFNNVVISGNHSSSNGGGIYNVANNAEGTGPTYTNVTIAGNYAATSGGGIYNGANNIAPTLVRNSIIYGNSSSSGPNVTTTGTITFTNSIVQGSGGNTAWATGFGTNGGNNKDADPKFVNLVPATADGATTEGNYSLQNTSSPANNAGSNTYSSSFGSLDIAKRERVQDGVVNMGAYESFDMALPVNFGNVSAEVFDNVLIVNWQTLKETNVDHFEIEVSKDSKSWKKASDNIISKAAGGNSDINIQYEQSIPLSGMAVMGISVFLLSMGMMFRRNKWLGSVLMIVGISAVLYGCAKNDNDIVTSAEKVYVRIKQVDKDGTASYSKVITALVK